MKIGLQIYQSRREWPAQAIIVDRLGALEAAGYSGLWVVDHHLDTYDDGYLTPLETLAFLAARTHTMELGQSVLLSTMHHPVLLAEAVSTLAMLSGNRVVLGLGIGWERREFAALGISYETRVGRFLEGLTLLQRLLNEDHVSFAGRHFRVDDVTIGIRPASPISVLLAGMGPAALRRIPDLANGWVASLWAHADEIAVRSNNLRHAFEARAKGVPDVVVSRYCCIRTTHAAAWRAARSHLDAYVSSRAKWGHPVLGVDTSDVLGRSLIGTPDEVSRQIARYESAGVTRINLRLSLGDMTSEDPAASLDAFTSEVMPGLA